MITNQKSIKNKFIESVSSSARKRKRINIRSVDGGSYRYLLINVISKCSDKKIQDL